MLKKLGIQYFRGFYTRQDFEFAIPDCKNNGSGLTIVVGPNNSGKTTFIEALTFHNDDGNAKRFNDSERHKRPPIIKLTDTNGITEKITNVNEGSQVRFVDSIRIETQIECIASRRHWQSAYSGTQGHGQMVASSNKNVRNVGDPGTAQRLATINLDAELRNSITNLMKRLVPNFSFWTVGTRDPAGDYIKYKTGNDIEHSIDMMGDGVISLFRICQHLIVNEGDSTLVIDEPELSLHPWAQKELHKIISEFAKNKQIIIVTHSPLFVDWQDFMNGAAIIRLNKPDDRKCIVSNLKKDSTYGNYISKNVNDWQKPELLDTVSKEIMFSEKILFVEGKEDVGILRKWIKENSIKTNFDIFGYGVGGETQMELFLKLSRDLGLSKTAALFDGNATSYNACKSSYSDYHICKISTDDIRDKFEGQIQTKVGTFTRKGELKDEQAVKFNKIFDEIVKYFDL